jgi:hypothetical protein
MAAIATGIVAALVFINPSDPRAGDRAALLGQGFAFVTLIPLFVIWILWADRLRKQRQQRQVKAPTKRKPRT